MNLHKMRAAHKEYFIVIKFHDLMANNLIDLYKKLAVKFENVLVYGPGAREQMLIPKILKNDVDYINVDHSRDFIHIDDVIREKFKLIKSKECWRSNF